MDDPEYVLPGTVVLGIRDLLSTDWPRPPDFQHGGPTLPERLRGDGPCVGCGTEQNIVWFTDNVIWNRVVREPDPDAMDKILCISCFVIAADRLGIDPTGWRLLPDFPVRYQVRACDQCGWVGKGECPRGPGDHD